MKKKESAKYTVIEYVDYGRYIYLGRETSAGTRVWRWWYGVGGGAGGMMTNIHDIIARLDASWDDIMGRGHHMIDDHEVTDTLPAGAWEDICQQAISVQDRRYHVIAEAIGDLSIPGRGWIDIWPGRTTVIGRQTIGIYPGSWQDANPPDTEGITYHATEQTYWPHSIMIYECSPPGTCRYAWRPRTAYDGDRVNIIDELAHYICGLYDTSSYYHNPRVVSRDSQALYDVMMANDDETSRIIAYGAYIPDADPPTDSYRIRIYPGISGICPRVCSYCYCSPAHQLGTVGRPSA